MRYTLRMYKNDMGSFTQPGCKDTEDALWFINKAREHDALPPIELEMLEDMLRHPKSNVQHATLTPEN